MNDTFRRARFRMRRLRWPLVWLRHRNLDQRDVFIISYPRSGTTWLRFLLSEIYSGVPSEFTSVSHNVRYIGSHKDGPRILPNGGRLLFSHERFPLKGNRVIYAVRDPRSVVTSEFNWQRRRRLWNEDFEEFLIKFLEGRTNPWGGWGDHVDYWLHDTRSRHKALRVKFEDLRGDTLAVAMKIANFLGDGPSESQIRTAIESNQLEKMREKEERAPDHVFASGANRDIRFVRRGSTDMWSSSLSHAHIAQIEERYQQQMLLLGYLSREAQ
jgi:hypothetical protein